MCAINGYNFHDDTLIEAMNAATKHRGPDGTGVYGEAGITLGHNRLSIIDLSDRASQPMMSTTKQSVITYNGELYNYRELREDLYGHYRFRTESDTEVILAAYERWGDACVERFDGMFAFALWDRAKKRLLIARDQIGIKPLYYYWAHGTLIFSSELHGVLVHDIPRTLNVNSFNHYLRLQYVPGPETMVQGIKKLPPGHRLVLAGGTLSIGEYYHASPTYTQATAEEYGAELKGHNERAVRAQLVSDRPVGVFLSGGFDSSVLLHHVADSGSEVKTFSVGFEMPEGAEAEKEKFNADFMLARKTASHYKTKHRETLISERDVIPLFEDMSYFIDEPIANATELAMLALSRQAKKEVAVVLSGEGGDELYGGYDRYRLSLAASTYQQHAPEWLRKMLKVMPRLNKLNTPAGIERYELFMFQKDDELRDLISPLYFHPEITRAHEQASFFETDRVAPYDSFEAAFMAANLEGWLVDEALAKNDRMTMAAGLEARVPLLDIKSLQFALNMPTEHKISLTETKKIVKQAYRGHLPEHIYREPKRGFFSPAAKWMRVPEIDDYIQNVLSPGYYPPIESLFDWKRVQSMVEEHRDHKAYARVPIWNLLTFITWARRMRIELP